MSQTAHTIVTNPEGLNRNKSLSLCHASPERVSSSLVMQRPRLFPARTLLLFWHVHPDTVGGQPERLYLFPVTAEKYLTPRTHLAARKAGGVPRCGVVFCWRASGFLQLLDEEVYTGAISLSKLVGHNQVTRPGQWPDL